MLGGGDADDAVQEAFCRLWGAAGAAPQSAAHAEALSRTAVRNASIDILRHSSGTCPLDEAIGDEAPPPQEDSDELFAEVRKIIDARLSERDRRMLCLREMHGYEWEELAEMFGTTEGNARMIVSRARKAVREYYRQLHDE